LRTVFDIARKRERIKIFEKELQNPQLWLEKEKAIKISQEQKELKKEINDFNSLEKELEFLDSEEKIAKFEKKLREKEIQTFLSGKYDKIGAILSIYAGAGGQDSQDWATLLLRMYEKYCRRKGFRTQILNQSFGEGGGPEGRIGTKQVCLEIIGPFAYGFLKKENGVHRLVRISPFSPKKLRHTSFASVEVIPKIPKTSEIEIKIRPEDLKFEFYRASGPGGQYVNKKETSVRVTHLPTRIQSASQSERFQAQNKEKAMELLYSKLYKFYEEKRERELSKIKTEKVTASFGNQIRSYVLQPYKLVKDLRTGVQTSKVDEVLDGELEQFIEAEINLPAGR
jgi:peptide chain release factor 2